MKSRLGDPLMLGLLLLLFTLAYLGQSLIKSGLQGVPFPAQFSVRPVLDFYLECAKSWKIWSGLLAVTAGFAIWISILSRLDLSQALPLLALSYIPWLLIGHFVFNEPMGWNRIVGVLLITGGVALVGWR
jgi:drug/metabolite transporter (DMT)-like permease